MQSEVKNGEVKSNNINVLLGHYVELNATTIIISVASCPLENPNNVVEWVIDKIELSSS